MLRAVDVVRAFAVACVGAQLAACGGSVVLADRCGPRTYLDAGLCVGEPGDASVTTCGDGTVLDGSVCVIPPPPDAGLRTSSIDAGSECAIDDNIFIIDGDGGIYSGPKRVIQGGFGWNVTTESKLKGVASMVKAEFGRSFVRFGTATINMALRADRYVDIQSNWFPKMGQPIVDVIAWDQGCSQIAGEFTIVSVTFDSSGDVVELLANYLIQCFGWPNVNHGCIHVKPRPY